MRRTLSQMFTEGKDQRHPVTCGDADLILEFMAQLGCAGVFPKIEEPCGLAFWCYGKHPHCWIQIARFTNWPEEKDNGYMAVGIPKGMMSAPEALAFFKHFAAGFRKEGTEMKEELVDLDKLRESN